MYSMRCKLPIVAILSIPILLVSIIPFIFNLNVYAERNNNGDSQFEGVPNVIIKTDNNKYTIEPDYNTFFDDVTGNEVIKNKGAKDAKNLILERGETISISYTNDNLVFQTTVFLVDKNEKDRDIVTGNVDDRIEIGDIDCDAEDCQDFEIEIPSNIDKGKYKIVIDRDEDEAHIWYINKVKVQ